jgi:hypothetical protein
VNIAKLPEFLKREGSLYGSRKHFICRESFIGRKNSKGSSLNESIAGLGTL